MDWVTPEHSRSQVNAAGALLIDPVAPSEEMEWARSVVNNWRAAHNLPLDALLRMLQGAIAGFGKDALVAQRLKRLQSIEGKLRRFSRMKLSQMQDIGGCRAVLPISDDVRTVCSDIYDESDEQSRLYNYLENPKESGYRGIHIVHAYSPISKQHEAYRGMKVEMQLRSNLQHIWATAVESVATFTGQALKASSGNEDWLRLFSLMGSYIAKKEGLPLVLNTPDSDGEIRDEIAKYADRIDAIPKLEAYGDLAKVIERLDDDDDVLASRAHVTVKTHRRLKRAAYVHIRLQVTEKGTVQVRWKPYSQGQWSKALRAYEEAEKEIRDPDREETVLVSASSVDDLKRAYPNYFVDTSVFVEELRQAIT